MRVAFATLGCKTNQYETSLMCDELKGGLEITSFDNEADIYIINTCTVTHKADYHSRQFIRRALRNQDSKVIVTGCYAERNPDELKGLGAHGVFGNWAKNHITEIFHDLLEGREIRCSSERKNLISRATFNSGRTRAFLKIQDGCNYRCSYCIVPIVRGKARSAPPDNVYHEVRTLVEKGYREIVLSGIQLGSYGKDLTNNYLSPSSVSPLTKRGHRGVEGGKGGIVELLKELLKIKGLFRLRLSSIEPQDITLQLIDLMKTDSRICRHLHIPLQSGDDEILKAMGRNYTASYYRETIMSLFSEIPDIGLGTDIIVGFPNETKKHFLNTYNLLRCLPLTYFHVFSFSERPGTIIYGDKRTVNAEIIKERSSLLRLLCDEKNKSFKSKHIGRQLDVLVEDKNGSLGYLSGLTDNYLRVHLNISKNVVRRIISVKVKGFEKDLLIGEYDN